MTSLYRLLRPAIFRLDAERAHGLAAAGLWAAARLLPTPGAFRPGAPAWKALPPAEPSAQHPAEPLAQTIWGLRFPSPCGLAAGMDKGQVVAAAWFRLGFGFVEVGSVTPRPQGGNPRPRLFRLVEDRAVINRMGFNNPGAQVVARRLAAMARQAGPVGINLGKNKDTPNERAADDYVQAFELLAPFADYTAINVSSPNTPGLRALQGARDLAPLVEQVIQARDRLARSGGRRVPVLVKLSPDEPPERLIAVARAAVEAGADGIIATNTTLDRGALAHHPRAGEAGGLSGAPLKMVAERACARIFAAFEGKVPVIGVGGISSAEDAYARIRAGACLFQIYTALVFEGPDLPRRVLRGLAALLDRDGLTLSQAIGADAERLAALPGP